METNNTETQSKLAIRGVNVVYLVIMVLFITIGSYVQAKDFQSGILITEFLIITLPALVYVLMKKGSIKSELRLNKLHIVDIILVTMIFSFAYPIAIFINSIGNLFLSFFGKLIQSPIPSAGNMKEYIVLLLLVAGSAGFCEEILFRGLMLRGYESLGKWRSIIFTAVLFAVLHLNIQNILGPLFLGVILGYVVYTTNSIFAGMLGHFINNALSVTLGYLVMQLPFAPSSLPQELPRGLMLQSLILAMLLFGFIALITGPVMYFCIKALKEINMERRSREGAEEALSERQELRKVLKTLRLSWPLYISLCIFVFFCLVQFTYIVTGKSLFEVFF